SLDHFFPWQRRLAAACGAIRSLALLTAICCVATPLGGCLGEKSDRCSWGAYCPPGKVCDEAHRWCVLPSQLNSCRDLDDGAPCTVAGAVGVFFVSLRQACVNSRYALG
ncbi:MAG: hypothetical protein JW940_35465, partial [Polyangiaceae bacterium]|nr:hypothetical protein [Polyangiaceae bacterium]